MSEVKKILGFQFEPLRKPRIIRNNKPGSDSDSSWTTIESPDEELVDKIRFARCRKPVETWCKCENCKTMPTEDECTCCHELDSHQLLEIQGKKQRYAFRNIFKNFKFSREQIFA